MGHDNVSSESAKTTWTLIALNHSKYEHIPAYFSTLCKYNNMMQCSNGEMKKLLAKKSFLSPPAFLNENDKEMI